MIVTNSVNHRSTLPIGLQSNNYYQPDICDSTDYRFNTLLLCRNDFRFSFIDTSKGDLSIDGQVERFEAEAL